jgi:hypothetical protein
MLVTVYFAVDWRASYNGDTVIIDVSLVVELLFQLGVLLVRTVKPVLVEPAVCI